MYKVGNVYLSEGETYIFLGYNDSMFRHCVVATKQQLRMRLGYYMFNFEPYLMQTKKEMYKDYIERLSRSGLFIKESLYNENTFSVVLAGKKEYKRVEKKRYNIDKFLIKAKLLKYYSYHIMSDKEFKERSDNAFEEYYKPVREIDYDRVLDAFYVDTVDCDNFCLYYSPDKNAYYTAIGGSYYKLLQLRKRDTLYILGKRKEAVKKLSSFDSNAAVESNCPREKQNIHMQFVKETRVRT